MIKLTEEQRENWRKVLVSMGMIKFIVDALTDEELDHMANNVARMGNWAPITTKRVNPLHKQSKKQRIIIDEEEGHV